MGSNQKLENYLNKLDKALGAVSISEKAEIITELKSHVLDELERDPRQSIDQILQGLGEPEQVANRYLLERGLKTTKAPKHPMVKWLVLGFLGSFSVFLIFVGFVIYNFSPILQVNEQNGSVKILGGLIDISEGKNSLKLGGKAVGLEGLTQEFVGSYEVKDGSTLELPFSNGDLNITASDGDLLEWDCKVWGNAGNTRDEFQVDASEGKVAIKMDDYSGVKCELGVPRNKDLALKVEGHNGKIYLDEPNHDTHVKLSNGKVRINPEKKGAYKYDLDVVNGKIDRGFNSSSEEGAKRIAVSIVNGKIDYR